MLKIKDVKPVNNGIITTAFKYTKTELTRNGILLDLKKTEGNYKEYQTVERVGPTVRNVKPGDVVLLDMTRYIHQSREAKRDEESVAGLDPEVHIKAGRKWIEWPIIEFGDEEHLDLLEGDIHMIIIPEK